MENDKKKAPKFSLTWVYIIIAVVLGYLMINSEGSGTMLGGTSRIVTYGEFKTYVEKGSARNIVASKDKGSLQMFVEAEHIRDVFKQTTVEKGKLPFVETQYPLTTASMPSSTNNAQPATSMEKSPTERTATSLATSCGVLARCSFWWPSGSLS